MPYLMHIALDNPFRLRRQVCYFEYKGVRFKLIQNNPRKWSDVLLTLVDGMSPHPGIQHAFGAAGEWASSLAWEFDVGLGVRHIGGPGIPRSYTLRRAKCVSRVFPEIPFRGSITGFDINRITRIDTDAQRKALTLFREAKSANKVWLSVLFYWQILEVGSEKAQKWVDEALRKDKQLAFRSQEMIAELPLKGRSVGDYLVDDCRHAIAHIRRWPGKASLNLDDEADINRIWRSARLLELLAKHYIKDALGVKEHLYLARHRGRGFPTYLDRTTIDAGWYKGVRK